MVNLMLIHDGQNRSSACRFIDRDGRLRGQAGHQRPIAHVLQTRAA